VAGDRREWLLATDEVRASIAAEVLVSPDLGLLLVDLGGHIQLVADQCAEAAPDVLAELSLRLVGVEEGSAGFVVVRQRADVVGRDPVRRQARAIVVDVLAEKRAERLLLERRLAIV